MSAVEEYREQSSLTVCFTESVEGGTFTHEMEVVQKTTAEAAIAELEAENERLREENKRAVYGCCEECRALAGLERDRDEWREAARLWREDAMKEYPPWAGGPA